VIKLAESERLIGECIPEAEMIIDRHACNLRQSYFPSPSVTYLNRLPSSLPHRTMSGQVETTTEYTAYDGTQETPRETGYEGPRESGYEGPRETGYDQGPRGAGYEGPREDPPIEDPTIYTKPGEAWSLHEKRLALCILIIVFIMRTFDVIAS